MTVRFKRLWWMAALLVILTGCAGTTAHVTPTPTDSTVKLSGQCDNLDGLGTPQTPTGTYPLPTTDGDGAPLRLPSVPPARVVTLRPAASEIAAALGLSDHIVGVDRATDYPAALTSKPAVTDAQDVPQLTTIRALKPNLVLSEGGTTATSDASLRKAGIAVLSLPRAATLPGVLGNILLVGQALGATPVAQTLVARMEGCITAVSATIGTQMGPAAYVELGYSPTGTATTVGHDTLEAALLAAVGGQNVFAAASGYPAVSATKIIAANPQTIILAEPITVPYVKPQERPAWSTVAAVQNSRIFVVHDELLGRAGPRCVMGLAALAEDLWPTLFS